MRQGGSRVKNQKNRTLIIRAAFVFSAGLLLALAIPTSVLATDGPHDSSNTIGCANCHGGANCTSVLHSMFWGGVSDEDSFSNLCCSCHNKPGGGPYSTKLAPYVVNHSSTTTSTKYGTWSNKCVACHDPHAHHLKYVTGIDSELKLMSGVVTGYAVDTPSSGFSQLTILGSYNLKSGWTEDKLENKSLSERGAIIFPNTNKMGHGFSIHKDTDLASNTIVIKGNISKVYNAWYGPPSEFVVIYGQDMREYVDTDDDGVFDARILFTDRTGPKSFAHIDGLAPGGNDSTVDGICQVCHTQTSYFRNTGGVPAGNHADRSGVDCMLCHAHQNGFKGSGGDHGTDLGSGYAPISVTASCGVCHTDEPSIGIHGNTCSTCHTNSPPDFNGVVLLRGASAGGSNDCAVCHSDKASDWYQHNVVHTDEGMNAVLEPSAPANNLESCMNCHTGNVITGVHDVNAAGDTYPCQQCHNPDGALRDGEDGYGDARLGVGGSAECSVCHGAFFGSHPHHYTANNQVSYNTSTDTSQAGVHPCGNCHNDAVSTIPLDNWPDIFLEHDTDGSKDGSTNSCGNCHNYDGSKTAPLADVTAAISSGGPVTCASCHTDKVPNVTHHGESCIRCHGHESGSYYDPDMQLPYSAGENASQGRGTTQSHSTHTETDSNDLRGPAIYCGSCHDLDNMPLFINQDATGGHSLASTDICDVCHSPGGSFDGVNDGAIGAKSNWQEGIYDEDASLKSGKEKWCSTCHDESASVIDSISAPNVVGNDSGAYTYGTGWGYYKTGHGLPATETYPASGGVTTGAGKGCLDCHDSTTAHVDGTARTFDCSDGCDSAEYRNSYRLQLVDTNEPLEIPWTGLGSSDATKFRLCTQVGCHDSGPFTDSGNMNTNLVTWQSVEVEPDVWEDQLVNRHQYHLSLSNQNRYPADYNYASITSRINCVTCHNVHGSTQLAMVRDGKLIDREPGLKVWYNNDDIVSYQTTNSDPPDPESLPLAASTGTIWRGGTSANLCTHCHANNNTLPKYRDPFQDVSMNPVLSWTGEANYESDGVHPDSNLAESSFTFRIKYTDANNDLPAVIEAWVDGNDSNTYEAGERYTMSEVDSGDTNCTDGKIYVKTLTISKAGDNTLNYRFYAFDGTAASGAPTADSTLSVANNVPVLAWTEEAYYADDGVNPDSGGNGASFEFRVRYADLDNEAPTLVQVWVDGDDSGTYDASEKHTMTVSGGDGDYTNGEIYTKTLNLPYAGDGIYNYRFFATDGGDDASGSPTSNSTVMVTQSNNNPPLLEWYSANCLTDGVRPPTGAAGVEYQFLVKYSDVDNDAPAGIQVWIDGNDSGTYDGGEKYTMTVSGGDGDYTNGEVYTKTLSLPLAGDGILNYRFFATDGTDDAMGDPVAGSEVTVLSGVAIRPAGSSLTHDYTSVITAINAVSGNVVVYPNDDFSAATYSENIAMYNKDDRNVIGACGADYTIISSASTGHAFTIQDSANFVADGFSITGATNAGAYASGFYVNRVDSTTVVIKNSKVYGNYYGIYINDADDVPVQIENVEIYNNSGRGIYLVNADDDANIVNCEIHSHNSSIVGAGIASNDGASVTIDKTVIRDNITTSDGGGIRINNGSLTITNSVLVDNQGNKGGAISSMNGPTVSVVNSTFADNTATDKGGVLYLCQTGSHTFRNSIFWNNAATNSGDVAYKDCSGFFNGFMTVTDSDVSTDGTNFGNGTPTVSNNITPAQNPLFADAAADDYHVQAGSPVIDQANAAYAPADDIDGQPRPEGVADDMGADEKW